MAVVSYSGHITDIRGKVGNAIFKGNLGASVLCSHPPVKGRKWGGYGGFVEYYYWFFGGYGLRRINPNGLALGDVYSQLPTLWNSLTTAQQAAWGAYATTVPRKNKVGTSYVLSPQQMFNSANAGALMGGGGELTTPPVPHTPPNAFVFSIVTWSTTVLTINLPTAVPSGFSALVKISRSISPGINLKLNKLATVQYIAAGTSGNVALFSNYVSFVGAPRAGAYVSVSVFLVHLASGVMYPNALLKQVIA